jgi:hypothetical protein
MDGRQARRTVHLKVPRTGRSLCGHEEESPGGAPSSLVVACPECSALIRSGVAACRADFPNAIVGRAGPTRHGAR